MHPIFLSPDVEKLRSKIETKIDQYHRSGGPDFGALGMVKWLHVHLTREDIDLLADIETEAGENEATTWLSEALSRDVKPVAAA